VRFITAFLFCFSSLMLAANTTTPPEISCRPAQQHGSRNPAKVLDYARTSLEAGHATP
jgi:hypothetical protein